MKKKILESIEIPSDIQCKLENHTLICKKDSIELSKKFNVPGIEIKYSGNKIIFECQAGNKNQYKIIKTLVSHVRNLIRGLNEKFVYELESCNVHFPMTLKVIDSQLAINNFLGEKKTRYANIAQNVDVDIKGAKIIVSSADKEAAGRTATNFEKATKITNRDRRIFQDGIYITKKPGAQK